MAIKFKDIFQHFLPSGDVFKPKPGGNLDKLYSGICNAVDMLVDECRKVSKVRDPSLTDMLEDLEKDYGLISDSNLTEDERRTFLNVFAFGKNEKGTPAFLQGRLRSAGFDQLSVYENSPEIDPNEIIGGDYRLYLGDENAYVGDPDALIGRSIGELFVDGVNTYTIPSNERLNYVFFVGGESYGWNILYDYNMEDPSTKYWTPNEGTVLTKDTSRYNSKNKSLKVSDDYNTEEQEPFVFPTCAPMSSFRFYDKDKDLGIEDNGDFVSEKIDFNGSFESDLTGWTTEGNVTTSIQSGGESGSKYLKMLGFSSFPDTMEHYIQDISFNGSFESDLTGWTTVGSPPPVISIESGGPDGSKYIKMYGYSDGVSTNYVKTANILTIGKKYKISGYFYGWLSELSIAVRPKIYCGTSQLVYGPQSGSSSSSTWTQFQDIEFVAEDEYISLAYINTSYSTCHVGFDGLEIKEYEDTADYIKTGDILTIGKKYRISGFYHGDRYIIDSVAYYFYPEIYCGMSQQIFAPTTGGKDQTEFTYFEDIEFTAEAEYIVLCYNNSFEDYYYVGFDGLVIEEISDYSVGKIINIAPINLIQDPTMDIAGRGNWGTGNSADISKVVDAYRGKYGLFVGYNGTANPFTYQSPLNKFRLRKEEIYKVSGYVKTDGTCIPIVSVINGIIGHDLELYSGDGSSWEYFEETFKCSMSDQIISFGSDADGSGQYAIYDCVSVVPLRPDYTEYTVNEYNMIPDGNCQDPYGIYDSTYSTFVHWNAINDAILSKDDSIKGTFDYALKIEYDGTANPTARSYCTVIDKKYRITGKILCSDSAINAYIKTGTDTIYWYEPLSPGEFEDFCLEFNATSTYLDFVHDSTTGYIEIDDIVLTEISAVNNNGENIIEKIGRTISFESTDVCDIYNISNYDLVDRFTITGWIKPTGDSEFFTNDDFTISIVDSKLVFDGISSTDELNLNEWNHFALSVDTNETQNFIMWINGVNQDISSNTNISAVTGGATIQEIQISNISFYAIAFTNEECYQDYLNGMSVFFGGTVQHEASKGIQNVNQDIEIDQTKIRQEIIFDAREYSEGDNGILGLVLTGSGDDPVLSGFDYSSNKSIVFLNGKHFASEDYDYLDFANTSSNCFVFRFVCKNEDGEVFSKYEDSGNYWKVEISSGIIYFKINTNSEGELTFYSEALTDEYLFCDILLNLETGNYEIYVNGENVTDTGDTIANMENVSNSGFFSVGKSSENTISFISLFHGVDIF